jgi:hypothetical protein
MQPHEGPRRNARADEQERRRQRALTWRLSAAILVLAGLAIATWIWR